MPKLGSPPEFSPFNALHLISMLVSLYQEYQGVFHKHTFLVSLAELMICVC